jgi:FkbM family methyltransferase
MKTDQIQGEYDWRDIFRGLKAWMHTNNANHARTHEALRQIANTINATRKDLVLERAKADPAGHVVAYHGLSFFVTNEETAQRAIYALEKEPDTIKWIDQLKAGERFWDIGANVGVFTLYAAKRRSAKVLAFEPVFSNYFILNRSIAANDINSRVDAFAIAITDSTRFGHMSLASLAEGTAMHTVDRSESGVFKQATPCFSIDDLVEKFGFEVPHHIKIDVDGFEEQVIKGALHTLKKPELKTVMVELTAQSQEFVSEQLMECGLELAGSFHRIAESTFRNNLFVRVGEKARWRHLIYDAALP